MTAVDYAVAKKIETRVHLYNGDSLPINSDLGRDGNRIRLRLCGFFNTALTDPDEFVVLYYVPDDIEIPVGVINRHCPQVEISLDHHGDMIYGPFHINGVATSTDIFGVSESRIILQVE